MYNGNWKDDMMNGIGTKTWEEGISYAGSWKNSQRNGYGEIVYKTGKSYKGDYLCDKRHGYGVFRWPDGIKVYDGYWEHDQQHGVAKFTDSTG